MPHVVAIAVAIPTARHALTRCQETKKQRLEETLTEFVAYLPTVALSFKLEREEEERRAAEAT